MLFICLLFCSSAYSDDNKTEHRELAFELIQTMGFDKVFKSQFEAQMITLKKMAPEISESMWEVFFSKIDYVVIKDDMIDAYVKYYTREDLIELIKFIKTPVGQKMNALGPQIYMEVSTTVSNRFSNWAREALAEL